MTSPTLAQRYDPAPADARRYETAIARRNTAWAHWREAADLMAAVGRLGGENRYVIGNYNDCLDQYERANDDLIRAKVWWQDAGRPW